MKYCLVIFLFLSVTAKSQDWMAEVMAGTAGYNGDLTQNAISIKRLGLCGGVNIKYVSVDYWSLRAGVFFGQVSGNDRQNQDPGLKVRNLDFKSNVIEFNLCAELAVVDPELYFSYPYLFGGVGLFHYNPYTHDKDNKKVFLRPLGTEGQGLPQYPDRKMYSLTQFCVPIGVGWKVNLKNKWQVSYEFGYRILFTDYLDDVSKRYVDPSILAQERGPLAAELAYRSPGPFPGVNEVRGNSKVNDFYFFTGFKIATWIGKSRKEKQYE